jgi:hypothetical protein
MRSHSLRATGGTIMTNEQAIAPTAQAHATHQPWREGARAGLIGAGFGALWSLLVDVVAGHPFGTFQSLGYWFLSLAGPASSTPPAVAVAVFLAFVALLFMLIGRIAVAAAHRADRQPSLIVFASTILTLVTLAFVAFATAFSKSRLGVEAWAQIFGSTMIALWTLVFRVYRTHPSLATDITRASD